MSKILVLFNSMYGRTAAMTQAVTEGARSVLPYTVKGQMRMDEVTGGTPYGASTQAGDGQRQPSANELDGARFQGRHVALIAAKLAAP